MDLFKYLVIVLLIASTVLLKGMNAERGNPVTSLEKRVVCSDMEVFQLFQTGIIEFFPLATGFKVKVNEEGNHDLSVKDDLGNIIEKRSLPSYEWSIIDGMAKGSYTIVIILEEGDSYSFKLVI